MQLDSLQGPGGDTGALVPARMWPRSGCGSPPCPNERGFRQWRISCSDNRRQKYSESTALLIYSHVSNKLWSAFGFDLRRIIYSNSAGKSMVSFIIISDKKTLIYNTLLIIED